MVNDRTEKHKVCCDKLKARSLVPSEFLVPLLLVSKKPEKPSKYPCVIKCSHDSGSSKILFNESDYLLSKDFIQARLSKVYGVSKGEWAYEYADALVMIEELLPDSTDYKFHISDGVIRWVQVISDRFESPKETIFDSHGNVLSLHLDEKMAHCPDSSVYPGENAWKELTDLALRLADGFRYVRIDLYYCGKPYFGEFTFWPRAGNYQSGDLDKFGEMLCLKL
jgi:hypothetical protein